MSLYDINYTKLASLLMPMRLRGGALNALARLTLVPLGIMRGELVALRSDMDYRMNHNSQVCRLRGLLNDKFDPQQREIRILDNEEPTETATLYQRQCTRFLRPGRRGTDRTLCVFRRGYGGGGNVGFWVRLPGRLLGKVDTGRIDALLQMYKLAGIRYGLTYDS